MVSLDKDVDSVSILKSTRLPLIFRGVNGFSELNITQHKMDKSILQKSLDSCRFMKLEVLLFDTHFEDIIRTPGPYWKK